MIEIRLSTNETIDLCQQVADAITESLNSTGRYKLDADKVFNQLYDGDFMSLTDFVEGVIND
ncbi:hypothetical protein [Acinetobacter sp. YH12245]|uniref:hypothetical protein n=1 Tax=Acinetobacter sp. YH12245 TaxID=2601171 RepID=UPI0015D43E23|nr:hypothetical protein [Acinetobacter sp. YH12245]